MKNAKEIEDFENQIFDKEKNPGIKYTIDHSIEASVKYEFLIESYGKEKVDALVSDFHDLRNYDYFLEISSKLESSK